MLEELLLPDASCLRLEGYAIQGETLVFSLSTTQVEAICPHCQTPSQRQNGRYERKPADLPCFDYRVRLDLSVRRFFCENSACGHVTFAQRLPTVVAPYARRTNRLAQTQEDVAYETGGELGERLLTLVRMNISADTVLRLIRGTPDAEVGTPRVLGVDDWALCKGQTYGTILVDLELHQVVDLLPECSAEMLSAWLQEHPGVEIISRDRGVEYIKGASEGAPNAIQVADRWHLLQNLKVALIRLLERKTACLRAVVEAPNQPEAVQQAGLDADSDPKTARLTLAEQDRLARRAKRQTRYEQVMTLHEQGVGHREIARRLNISRQTIVKYINADACPLYPEGRNGPNKLDPYLPYLQQRWDEGCHNASQLWREIRTDKFKGSRGLVAVWAAEQRKRTGTSLAPTASRPRSYRRPLTPGRAVWLFLKTGDNLSLEEQATLQRLLRGDAQLAQAYTLAQAFATMVRERQSEGLESWLAAVAGSNIISLQRFANGLRQDLAAVKAALSLPWSNGQTEGQINRLKLIKRQMYGRANFDLLRKRVLPKPHPAPS